MSEINRIKNFYGKTVATVEQFQNGDAVIRDFYGKVLGRYTAHDNRTRDFYGRVVATGNALTSLIEDWN